MELVTNIIGYIAAFIGAITFLPQVIKAWKTKRTKDVSFASFSLLALVSALWISYGLLLKAGPVILVNIIILTLSIFLLFLKRKYG